MSQSIIQQESAVMPQVQNKSKVIVPPMHYRLAKLTQHEALSQIGSLTRGLYDLPPDLAHWIHWDICSRQFTSFG